MLSAGASAAFGPTDDSGSFLPQNGILACTALFTFLRRPVSAALDWVASERTCPSAHSSSSAGNGAFGNGAFNLEEEIFGCWATWRRALEEGTRRMPMLDCREPTGGRRGC